MCVNSTWLGRLKPSQFVNQSKIFIFNFKAPKPIWTLLLEPSQFKWLLTPMRAHLFQFKTKVPSNFRNLRQYNKLYLILKSENLKL